MGEKTVNTQFIITLDEEAAGLLESVAPSGEAALYLQALVQDAITHNMSEDVLARNEELMKEVRNAQWGAATQDMVMQVASNKRRLASVMDQEAPVAKIEPA
jgi:hypothetical protein